MTYTVSSGTLNPTQLNSRLHKCDYYCQFVIIIRPRHSRSTAAYSLQTFPLTICQSVCLSSALWKNGGPDPDAMTDHFKNQIG